MNKDITSFTSASIFPSKVVKGHPAFIVNDKILPYHVQINPTNLCNLSCSFCSCSNRKKLDLLSIKTLKEIMQNYFNLGCRAVTITGGGEPTLHPEINEAIRYIKNIGIKIGLVTNGTMFDKLSAFESITWIRISSEDTRDFDEKKLDVVVKKHPNVDWAFSHVVSKTPNFNILTKIIKFANEHNFTHVRLVSNLFDTENVDMSEIEKTLCINDSKVIYQGRKTWTKGSKKCLISLLKPVIGADGGIYPCCGVQYAHENPKFDLHDSMKMGDISKDIFDITIKQKYFDGSKCDKCYYSEYNLLLDSLTHQMKHEDFV